MVIGTKEIKQEKFWEEKMKKIHQSKVARLLAVIYQ